MVRTYQKVIIILVALIITTILGSLTVEAGVVIEDERVNLTAEQVEYRRREDLVIAIGNVHLKTAEIEIWADRMELEVEKNKLYAKGNVRTKNQDGEMRSKSIEYDLRYDLGIFIDSEGIVITEEAKEPLHIRSPQIDYSPDKSTMKGTQMTSCDDYSHYYFKSNNVTIYPGDKLIAYHTVFWELGGRLPLFYWPVFIYSLRHDDQMFQPELGYHRQRGWFLKTTYNYYFSDQYDNPFLSLFAGDIGQLYIDYFSNMGFAGGFKHYYATREDDQGFLEFYIEDDRRNRDLRPWIELELDRRMRYEQGERLFNLEYSNHNPNTYLTNPERMNLFELSYDHQHSFSKWDTELDTEYRKNQRYDNYFDLGLNLDRIQADADDSELELDLGYNYATRDEHRSNQYDFGLDYTKYLVSDIELDYGLGYQFEQEDDADSKWDYDTLIRLSQRRTNFDWQIEADLEGDQEAINSYELPLASLSFSPDILVDNYFLSNTEVEIGGANSYSRGSQGLDNSLQRGYLELDYSDRFNLTDNNRISTFNQNFRQDAYDTGHQHWLYESDIRLTTTLLGNWSHRIDHNYATLDGEAPDGFSLGNEQHSISNRLNWRRGSSNFYLTTGYDLLDEEYDPLNTRLRYHFTREHNINTNLRYNINNREFTRFDLAYEMDYQNFTYETEIKADLNTYQLEEWENEVSLSRGDWKFEAQHKYNYQQERVDRANLMIERKFHCRKLVLTYDHLIGEVLLRYEILAFPQSRTEFGTREGEGFIYDSELGGLLDDFE